MDSDVLQHENCNTQSDRLFLRTKLHLPGIQQKLIPRVHIDNKLNDGLKGRVILVTAPAGFGKTTAVAEWIRRVNMPAAWLSIDSYDNSLKRFWSYLLAALDTVLPGIKCRFSQYFHSPNSMIIEGIVATLIDELFRLKNDLILVMDDYHLIEEVSVHESLALLIKYLPENVHITIISRSKPPFIHERMKTVGLVKEVKLSDLKFTTGEITDLCFERGLLLSKNDIKALESFTEGWAAGLYLTLDSMRHDFDFAKLLSDSRWDSHRIASYLTEEVMGRWTGEERDFMLKTSVLSSMSGSLCDALTGRTDGQKVLERLSDHNAFVISMDNEGCWYRYHHLYSEFLQKSLEKINDISRSALHEKAGAWYEKNGYLGEAVGHFLQSGAFEAAANVIEKKGREMLKTGDFPTLLGWLGSLPASIIEGSDMLCLTYAWALGLSGRIDEAAPWINIVESRCSDTEAEMTDKTWRKQMETEVVAFRGTMGLKSESLHILLESMMKFSEMMPGKSIFCIWGLNYNTGEASLLAGMFGLRGYLSIVEKEYAGIYEKLRKDVIKKNFGYIPVLMGEMLFERNNIDKAVPLLMKGIDEAESSRASGSFIPSIITLAKIMKAKGDMNGAFQIVRDGEKRLKDMGGIHMLPLLTAFRTRLGIEAGDDDIIEDWMRKNCLDIYDKPGMQRMYEHITLARVLITSKDYDNCMLLLYKLLLFAKKEHNLFYTIEILNLQAIVYHAQAQTQKAMEVIRESLNLGEKEGYERIFIEEGMPMAALLGRFLKWYLKQEPADNPPVSPVYVRNLMKHTRDYCITIKTCIKGNTKDKRGTSAARQALTKREMDVLRLLDSELTNAEIACTLDITLNTVKVNCTNIYRKLDVKNREQAVRYAREMNILTK